MKKKNKKKTAPHNQNTSLHQNAPLRQKEQVMKSNDSRIDEDFPGYPHHPASEQLINPKNAEDRASADLNQHNGSGGAFEATESMKDDE